MARASAHPSWLKENHLNYRLLALQAPSPLPSLSHAIQTICGPGWLEPSLLQPHPADAELC